jgi:hypothetical protein
MNRDCPKCRGGMQSETHPIPHEVPLPIPLSPTIRVDQYFPSVISRHNYYTVFVCNSCGYLEAFVHDT